MKITPILIMHIIQKDSDILYNQWHIKFRGTKYCLEFCNSLLGYLLLNIFICGMFYFLEEFNYENYTDFDYAYYTKRQWHIIQSVTHKVSWNEILFGVLQQSFRVFAVKHFHMRHVLLPWRLSLCKLCPWLYTR